MSDEEFEPPRGVPRNARKVPGLKLWADPHGGLWGPQGARLRTHAQANGRHVEHVAPLRDDGTQTSVTTRRAVALAWLGPQPDGTVLRSVDGNLANANPANLEWVPKRPRGRSSWEEWAEATARDALADPGHPAHGSRWLYGRGCRCRACTNAQRIGWHKYWLRESIKEVGRRMGDA